MFLFAISGTVLYFLTRLYNILSLPIFTDEAIYVRWSQIANYDANWRFISLTDGKQPLFVWLSIISQRFIHDPLLAGRIVSVFAGLFTMFGLYFLGKTLFDKRAGICAGLLYIIFPFALVYDRMALYDSLVATFFVWSFLFLVLLVKKLRLDLALILGGILGGGVLTKTSGFISIYLLPLSLLLFDFKDKRWRNKLFKWVSLAVSSVVIAYVFYSILRLSPFLYIIDEKNKIFVFPIREWLSHPFLYFQSNLRGLTDWFLTYMTFPLAVLVALSFLFKKNLKEKVLLALWFFIPFISLALLGKTLYPRFILFMTMPLLLLAGFSLSNLLKKTSTNSLKIAVLALFLSFAAFSSFKVLTDFANAPIPLADRTQYLTDWPSGVGVKEAVSFFEDKAKKEKIYIGTAGSFGLMPYALEIYLWQNKNIEIKGYWPVDSVVPSEVFEKSKELPTYFLFYQPCPSCEAPGLAPKSWPLKEEFQVRKGNNAYLTVYKVLP